MRARRRAACDLQVHRALPFAHVVLVDQSLLERPYGVKIEAGVDAQFFEPATQSFGVPVPLEESAAHDASYFVNAVAEEEAAVVDGKLRLVPWEELAVQVHNRHVDIRVLVREWSLKCARAMEVGVARIDGQGWPDAKRRRALTSGYGAVASVRCLAFRQQLFDQVECSGIP